MELGANVNESGFHSYLRLFIFISEDLVSVDSGRPILWVMALHEQRCRGQGDAGGHLAAAPSSIKPDQGLLKSQRWKITRAQAVASMWAPSWINRPAAYPQCRACRREALAHGNGVTTGICLSCQCLNPRLGKLAELEAGTPRDCFAGIAVAAL